MKLAFPSYAAYCLIMASRFTNAKSQRQHLRATKAYKSPRKLKKAIKTPKAHRNTCGLGTEYDYVLKQCVVQGRAKVIIPSDCNEDDAECFCEFYGYGIRGPKLSPHHSCQKYVSCHKNDGMPSVEEAVIMQCEPGFAYDVVAQVCFFKESVDCDDREAADLGDTLPSQCLSDINPDDPICGCGTYVWNSATLVPDECYGDADVSFQCTKDNVLNNNLAIGIGDGIRPGRAVSEAVTGSGSPYGNSTGYLDAPWLESDTNPNGEYPYSFPLDKTALVMIDFQRDFVCPGGFGETLGNNVEDLQKGLQPARNVLKAARAMGMSIIHTLESHKSDLSDLHDNKFNRGDLPGFLRIGQELDLGRVLVRGSCGNNIVDMVAPKPGEYLIMKPGKTAFYMTQFDELLQSLGVTHLLFAGVTTEVCMQSSVREATDRGYEPLVITDATNSYFERYRQQTIEQLVAQGALVSWAAESSSVVNALEKACTAPL